MKFTYVKRLLDSNDEASIKRFITLIVSLHFIITSFLVSFFIFYMILYIPKGNVNRDLLEILNTIFEYDFYIIGAGIGMITLENLGNILLQRVKSKISTIITTTLPDLEPPLD